MIRATRIDTGTIATDQMIMVFHYLRRRVLLKVSSGMYSIEY